jgi:hypothetical protein
MSVDHIRYDLLTQDALRGVIRTVLSDAAVKGLPGDHHFFITFDTRADGVRMSARLKASYPDEMTIVLQHQFWDLAVGDDDFEVGLAFNGIPERLHIPLKAVKAFLDPSVQFGLQFTIDAESQKGEAVADTPAQTPPAAELKPAPTAKSVRAQPKKEAKPQAAPAEAQNLAKSDLAKGDLPKNDLTKSDPSKPATSPTSGKDEPTGEVVRLDRFRKK